MKYAAIKTSPTEHGEYIIVDEKGNIVHRRGDLTTLYFWRSDAIEIAEKLMNGADIEDFYREADPYAYGGELHQAYGDAFLYADLPGAW